MRLRALVCLLTIVLSVRPRIAPAQARLWNDEDRIMITSFNEVAAVAFDGQRVFGVSLGGLEIYDALARRWLLPSTREDGYPVFERPIAALYDRSQAGLWMLTASGNTYLWSELNGHWDLRAPGSAPAELTNASQAAASDPAWRVLRASLTDPQGRRWPLTSVTPADRPGTYWAATAGNNIIAADTRNLSAQWLSYGTLSYGVSAVAVDGQGALWLGSDGLGPRNGVTRTDVELQSWVSYEPYSARAPRRAVNRILAGDTTWLAASDGVYALPPHARAWRLVDEKAGLPSDNVRAIARTSAGIWAGTQHGVAIIDPTTMRGVWRALEGVCINGLATANDTVWIAGDRGLQIGVRAGATYDVFAAPRTEADPRLHGRILGVTRTGAKIAVLTTDDLFLFDGTWSVVPRGNYTLPGSRPFDLRGSDAGLFVLGTGGVTEWRAAEDTWASVTVPADIPDGPVTDAVRVGEYVWLATPVGAIRLRWP